MRKLVNIIFPSSVSVFLLLLAPAAGLAAPSISSVSGTFAHGLPVKISGSSFGAKVPAKPLIWANFEDATISAIPDLSTGSLNNQSVKITKERQAPNSTHSVRGAPTLNGSKKNVRLYVKVEGPAADKFYIFVRRLYDHPNWWDSVRIYKTMRHWPRFSFGGKTNLVTTIFCCSKPRYTYTSEGSTMTTWLKAGTPPVQQWLREEYQAFHGTLNKKDARLTYWENGVVIGDVTFLGLTSRFPTIWRSLGAENFWSVGGPPNNAYVYFDDFYVDTTWARVMIGDQPTFEASTHREIQIPTAWSSNSITIHVNQGSFDNLKDKYLYIIDAQGKVNTFGFRIPTDPPPAPPKNVRVILK